MKFFRLLFLLSFCFCMHLHACIVPVVGSCCDQGPRKTMEDAIMVYTPSYGEGVVFGVFDGHAGADSAQYCAQWMGRMLLGPSQLSSDEQENVVKKTFKTIDDHCCQAFKDGSTAVVALFSGNTVLLANAGDSRAVVYHDGNITATSDHKPDNFSEQFRIEAAGGRVVCNNWTGNMPYVWVPKFDGGLATSRAVGDKTFKKNIKIPEADYTTWIVTCDPDMQSVTVNPGDFMVLACDGLYNVMENEDVVAFVKDQMVREAVTPQTITEKEAHLIAQRLVNKALTGHPDYMYGQEIPAVVEEVPQEDVEFGFSTDLSTDNVSVILVFFK